MGDGKLVATTKRQPRRQPSRQPSLAGRRGRAAARRRRVRATRNANGPHAGQRLARRVRRMRRLGPAGLAWSAITAVASVVAMVVESVATISIAAMSLGVTVAVAKIEAKKGRATPPPRPSQTAASRGSAGPARKPGTAGTPRPKARRKPAAPPPEPAGKRLDGGTGTRPRVCSDACQRSTRPKDTCRCTAPDCKHGQAVVLVPSRKAPGATPAGPGGGKRDYSKPMGPGGTWLAPPAVPPVPR